MATIWVCQICGSLPADNGVQTQGANAANTFRQEDSEWVASAGSQVNLNGAAALGDFNGHPPHCPACGAATIIANTATVQTMTGVVPASQHPVHVDLIYTVQTDAPTAQFGSVANTPIGGWNQRLPHTYPASAGAVKRGDQTITAETINATVGP